jgi:hypothetical protein
MYYWQVWYADHRGMSRDEAEMEYLKIAQVQTSVGDQWRIRIPDLHLLPTDPDPTSNPTPFFSDFKDAKKIILSYFFLADTLSLVLKI